jgi:hypothetical protein
VSAGIDVDHRVQVRLDRGGGGDRRIRRGRADHVVVIDEGIAVDHAEGAREEGTLLPIPSAVARRAPEIAEAGDWPVWEHGF